MTHLLVFSHLRWDFVFQRPQHLLSRLARQYPVLFVEEPECRPGAPGITVSAPAPGVEVLRPHSPVDAPGFHDDHVGTLQLLLKQFLESRGIDDFLAWFYTPMALPLLSELQPRGVIYDCMDELAAFKDAPRQMKQREAALLRLAKLVLTGGPSLFEAKAPLNPNVLCLPSAVDAIHYNKVRANEDRNGRTAADALQAHLPHPRLGFFGVIDERLDVQLLDHMAQEHPDWQIIMVGPVVKIDAARLPRRPNIHWLGHQPYELLPVLVQGWDVCLLPFALNEATRFISPTKTLEYMAAGRPIVSTPIHDVARLFSKVVRLGADATAFAAACSAALAETAEHREEREAAMAACVARYSWDSAAATVANAIETMDQPERQVEGAVSGDPEHIRSHSPLPRVANLIIGAGPTGLSAAYHLSLAGVGKDTLLIERERRVGGWCRSIVDKGFTFDFAGHIMFSNESYVQSLYETLLGSNVHWQNREAWIYSKGVYTRYPFQGALYGLPPAVLKECLVGALEARFGSLEGNGSSNPPVHAQNFEEFIYKVWGKGIARHFAIPYNEKLWATPLKEMETSWLGGRVPMPDLEQMIAGALEPTAAPMGPNARFGYPLRGGFQALMDAFLPKLDCKVALDTAIVALSPSARTVRLQDGRRMHYDTLISTMGLPQLVGICGAEVPPAIQYAARSLRQVSIRCVNLGIAREDLTDKHWIYYPEDTIFHRIFVQGNASPYCNAPGGFGITCEISYGPNKPLPLQGRALIDRVVADCKRVGFLRNDDTLITANEIDMPQAYVVYDHERAGNVARIRDWLSEAGIILRGRYSEWEYYNSDHAFLAGKRAADEALGNAARSIATMGTAA